MDRHEIASLICKRLDRDKERLRREFRTAGRIPSAIVDDLLPTQLAEQIHAAFPEPAAMRLQKSLKEDKYTAFEMNRYEPVLEETTYAFQQPSVVAAFAAITAIPELLPDSSLYLGGISRMERGQFLNPHIDNSHDRKFERFRVLNLLYYVSPGWKQENGGNFELWDGGLSRPQRVVEARFNRLVIMATYRKSLHSVSPIVVDQPRCCISNYYFSTLAFEGTDEHYFHGTYFRGRPDQRIRDLVLRSEVSLKRAWRVLTKKGRADHEHVYKSKASM